MRAHELASQGEITIGALSALMSKDRGALLKAALDMRKKAVEYPEGSPDREQLLAESKQWASAARTLYPNKS